MSTPAPRASRRLLLPVSIVAMVFVLLLGVLAWWLLPRWAPRQVIQYAPFPGMVVRAVSERDVYPDSAITALQALRAERQMVDYLDSANPAERALALRVLGKSRDPQYFAHLTNGLNDGLEEVREDAATALGDLGDPRAIPVLIGLLTPNDRNDTEPVRSAAAYALERLPATKVADAVEAVLEQHLIFPLILSSNTDARVPAWLDRALRKPGMSLEALATVRTPPLFIAAAMALARNPQAEATRLYLLALRDDSREIRGRAIIGLRRVGGARIRPELQTAVVDLLRDPDLQVLAQAVKYCSWKPLKEAFPGIHVLLTDPDPQRRMIAVSAYRWDFHDPDATQELLRLANDADDHLRAAAVAALGRIPKDANPRILPALLAALHDPARRVRCVGINAFQVGSLDTTIIAALVDLLARSLDPLDHQLTTGVITVLAEQALTIEQSRLLEDAKQRVGYVKPPTTQVIPPACVITEP